MLWACITLPHLALDTLQRRRPSDGPPLVLIDGPLQARYVMDADATAQAAGIRAGQALPAAHALLARFDAIAHDPALTAQQHDLLAAWAYRYSAEVLRLPDVGGRGALALEVQRSHRLFGHWPDFAKKLRDDLASMGFRHRLALAPTPLAARALAQAADGAVIADPARLRQRLARLPLACAGLPDGIEESLAGIGIHQLGALLALPRDGLRRRFGAALPDHLDDLLGEQATPLPRYLPPDRFDLRIEFNFDVENLASLAFPLRRLTGDLADFLAGRDGGVQRFVLSLGHRGHAPTRVIVGLLQPERDPAALFELARSRLERVSLDHPVIFLRLRATELPPFVPGGRDLFDQRPEHAIPLEQLQERLRARLGDASVHRLQATVDPRPEQAQRIMPARAAHVVPTTLPRPTWLLPKPVPLRGHGLRILAGPERIESGWWDGGDLRRDYYVLETADGQRAWAFCPPGERPGHDGGWMLHGWFA
jgi:protein ImuB